MVMAPSAPAEAMLAQDHSDWPFKDTWYESGPTTSRKAGRSRQTVHWPFQSIGTLESILTLPPDDEGLDEGLEVAAAAAARPVTWQPRGHHLRGAYSSSNTTDAGGSFDRTLVPDYVVNYLRGETPETMAQRQAEKKRRQADDVGSPGADGHGYEEGVMMMAAGGLGSPRSTTPSSAGGSTRHMLDDGAEKRDRNMNRTSSRRCGDIRTSSVARVLSALMLLSLLLSATSIVGVVVLAGQVTCLTTAPQLLLRAIAAAATAATLGSAQYVWQAVGSSPTRADVDAAHEQQRWLDVGVPSLRNLAYHLRGGSEGGKGRLRAIASLLVMAAALVLAVLQASVVTLSSSSSSSSSSSHINTPILAVVAGLHGLIAICLALILFLNRYCHYALRSRHVPLVTLGDAVASFLRDPDPTTYGACLLSKVDVLQGRWQSSSSLSPPSSSPRWFRAPSPSRWLAIALVWCLLAGLAAAALAVAITGRNRSISSGLGVFGQITLTVYSSPSSSSSSSFSLLAGLPHLGLALLYLLADGHLSVYFLAHESALFAAAAPHGQDTPHRPLRVSVRPRGFQTTSFYLTLPPLWAALLLLLSAAMHFALSSSLVVAVVAAVAPSSNSSRFLLGFSSLGFVVFLALLTVLAALVLGLALRCSPPVSATTDATVNPLFLYGGSCSAVISARCHPLPSEVAETMMAYGGDVGGDNSAEPLAMWLRPLAWGTVSGYHHDEHGIINDAIGHCTYTSRPVHPLEVFQSYA